MTYKMFYLKELGQTIDNSSQTIVQYGFSSVLKHLKWALIKNREPKSQESIDSR